MNRHISKVIVIAAFLAAGLEGFGQTTAGSRQLTREQQEEFLRTARITQIRGISVGVTGPKRATLTDGKLTHDAQIQTVDIYKARFAGTRTTEMNFTDSYKYNIAAYRLDKLLGLGMIPVSVKRNIKRKPAAVTWWVDDVLMTETERTRKNIPTPDPADWNRQMFCLRIFDQLIYNMDRNLENLVITNDWKVKMIDHTRAFRTHKKLKNEKNLMKCPRALLAALRKLEYAALDRELSPYLKKSQIKALLIRRDRIVQHFEKKIAVKGEEAVLYDLEFPPRAAAPTPTPANVERGKEK